MIARGALPFRDAAFDEGEIPALPLAFPFLADGVVEGAKRRDALANAGHAVLGWRLIGEIRKVSPCASQLLCMIFGAAPRDPASRVGGIEGCRGFNHGGRPRHRRKAATARNHAGRNF
ncbi:hypothetical protein [Sphingomonas sp. IW22]|uniref:hypothetical protein n=1 Tax=Sphingomonas sp. IW22 TaxID=3242489 RepID=UPI0035219A45